MQGKSLEAESVGDFEEKELAMSETVVDKQHELDQLSINALRFLAVDGVQKANSGHPGAPLACAPIAYTKIFIAGTGPLA